MSDESFSFERHAVVFYYLKTKLCDNTSHNFIKLQERRKSPRHRLNKNYATFSVQFRITVACRDTYITICQN